MTLPDHANTKINLALIILVLMVDHLTMQIATPMLLYLNFATLYLSYLLQL
jgi:hypothetical protein